MDTKLCGLGGSDLVKNLVMQRGSFFVTATGKDIFLFTCWLGIRCLTLFPDAKPLSSALTNFLVPFIRIRQD